MNLRRAGPLGPPFDVQAVHCGSPPSGFSILLSCFDLQCTSISDGGAQWTNPSDQFVAGERQQITEGSRLKPPTFVAFLVEGGFGFAKRQHLTKEALRPLCQPSACR